MSSIKKQIQSNDDTVIKNNNNFRKTLGTLLGSTLGVGVNSENDNVSEFTGDIYQRFLDSLAETNEYDEQIKQILTVFPKIKPALFTLKIPQPILKKLIELSWDIDKIIKYLEKIGVKRPGLEILKENYDTIKAFIKTAKENKIVYGDLKLFLSQLSPPITKLLPINLLNYILEEILKQNNKVKMAAYN